MKTSTEADKTGLSTTTRKESQKMRWKIREKRNYRNSPRGPTCAQETFQRENRQNSREEKTHFKKISRNWKNEFSVWKPHVLPMHMNENRPSPRHITVKFPSEEADLNTVSTILIPGSPSQGTTEDIAQQSKKSIKRKGRPMNQVTQLRTKAQGISRVRRKKDLWRRRGFRSQQFSHLGQMCAAPKALAEKSPGWKKYLRPVNILAENLDSLWRVEDRMKKWNKWGKQNETISHKKANKLWEKADH